MAILAVRDHQITIVRRTSASAYCQARKEWPNPFRSTGRLHFCYCRLKRNDQHGFRIVGRRHGLLHCPDKISRHSTLRQAEFRGHVFVAETVGAHGSAQGVAQFPATDAWFTIPHRPTAVRVRLPCPAPNMTFRKRCPRCPALSRRPCLNSKVAGQVVHNKLLRASGAVP